MRIETYINAASAICEKTGDVERTLSNLKVSLARRGLGSLYPRIVRGLVRKYEDLERTALITVRVAREGDMKTNHAHILKALGTLNVPDVYRVHVNPELIGGFIIEGHNHRIDASYKKMLRDAYTRMTAD